MRAMRNGKRVIHEDIAQTSKRSGEAGIVAFFTWMEPNVLHQQDVPRLGSRGRRMMNTVSPIGRYKLNSFLEGSFERDAQWCERIFNNDLATRPLEVSQDDDDRTFVREFGKDRSRMTNASVVRDHAALHRHVKIDADNDPFSDYVDSFKRTQSLHHRSLPIATAVSHMRVEKPHSLSYQLITRTRVPSRTLV